MKRIAATALTVIAASGAFGFTAVTTASAQTSGCVAGPDTANDRVAITNYGSYSDASGEAYQFLPATNPNDSRYGKNNVDLVFNNGTKTWSGDTEVRDGLFHPVYGAPAHETYSPGLLRVTFTNILNTSAQPDPSCTRTFQG